MKLGVDLDRPGSIRNRQRAERALQHERSGKVRRTRLENLETEVSQGSMEGIVSRRKFWSPMSNVARWVKKRMGVGEWVTPNPRV